VKGLASIPKKRGKGPRKKAKSRERAFGEKGGDREFTGPLPIHVAEDGKWSPAPQGSAFRKRRRTDLRKKDVHHTGKKKTLFGRTNVETERGPKAMAVEKNSVL